jgi:hypothetical protein
MKRLVLIVLELVVIFGGIRFYELYRYSSPTQDDVISDYIHRVTKNTPRKVESLTVVSSTQSGERGNQQILLFRAYDESFPVHIAGYAVISKSLFGWHVEQLQMTGKSPLPEDVMARLDWSERGAVIYGQVFLPNAATVEAIFTDPTHGQVRMNAEIPSGNFALFGSPQTELLEFKILDVYGNVLKQLTKDELQNE